MALTCIGLGLWYKDDISVRGLKAIQEADIVYLESYTSLLGTSITELESFYGKKILLATY